MQKITVLCVGKLKEKFYQEAAAEYAKRLGRHCKLEIIELPESRLPEDPSAAEIQRALAAEAAAIRERLPRGGAVIALCIEGKPCSSVELSRRMQELAVSGKSQLTFLIGGSVGLSEDLKRQADWRLSMSPMTFPHHLARSTGPVRSPPVRNITNKLSFQEVSHMDNSKWAFAPDAPEWPVNARGEKEKAVLLTSTFDSTADADMLISLLAAYRIPCFKYFDYEGGAGKVINGFSGYGASLYVPASLLEDAKEILEAEPVEEPEQPQA